jgi:hypothetical protein
VHPDVINKYYGVHGRRVRHHTTGAGHPQDEDDDSNSEMDQSSQPPLAAQMASDQQTHLRHAAIVVPLHGNPFGDSTVEEDQFWHVLSNVVREGITSEGIGLHQEEWHDGVYPSYESLRVSNRGMKDIHVSLADSIWKQQAKLWEQAYTTLKVMQMYL